MLLRKHLQSTVFPEEASAVAGNRREASPHIAEVGQARPRVLFRYGTELGDRLSSALNDDDGTLVRFPREFVYSVRRPWSSLRMRSQRRAKSRL
jgi:hypothetical protein